MTTKTIIRRIAKGLGGTLLLFAVITPFAAMLSADHWAWSVTAVAISVLVLSYMIGLVREDA